MFPNKSSDKTYRPEADFLIDQNPFLYPGSAKDNLSNLQLHSLDRSDLELRDSIASLYPDIDNPEPSAD